MRLTSTVCSHLLNAMRFTGRTPLKYVQFYAIFGAVHLEIQIFILSHKTAHVWMKYKERDMGEGEGEKREWERNGEMNEETVRMREMGEG